MAIAKTLASFLLEHGTEYELIAHEHSSFSMDTAEKAHVPGDALAKGILLKDEAGPLLVVLPSDYHIRLERLRTLLHREAELAAEAEVVALFDDCEPGAIPPIGDAYGIRTIWDPTTSLGQLDTIYFEAGDHTHLVRVAGEQFHELMAAAQRGAFSQHM
jgi:Ala-tRNA(Pro) deacylase